MSECKSKFKVGDKVVRITNCPELITWNSYTIKATDSGMVMLVESPYWFHEYNFELYKEEPKVKQFDIKKDAWFIHVPNTNEAYVVEAYLKEKGFSWIGKEHNETLEWMYDSYGEQSCIGCMQEVANRIGYADKEFYVEGGIPEIILTYKTVIDTITLPVLPVEPEETAAQKQLKVLKEQIAELSKQADVLEGSL